MMKIFWYRYFKHPIKMNADDGIYSFTEDKISDNLRELRKKITSLNSSPITGLEHNAEHENVIISDLVLRENKRKRNVLFIVIGILCIVEICLNYISFLAAYPGGGKNEYIYDLLRMGGTITLTLASVFVLEYFFENYLHKETVEKSKEYGISVKSLPSRRMMMIYALSSLILLAIIGFVVETRQTKVEKGIKNLSYYGLIMLSLILPIVAALFAYEWKIARKICTAALGKRRHLFKLRQNEAAKIGDKGKVANSRAIFFADSCNKYWKQIHDFKEVKAAYDKQKGRPPENLKEHKDHVNNYRSYQDYIESILNANHL